MGEQNRTGTSEDMITRTSGGDVDWPPLIDRFLALSKVSARSNIVTIQRGKDAPERIIPDSYPTPMDRLHESILALEDSALADGLPLLIERYHELVCRSEAAQLPKPCPNWREAVVLNHLAVAIVHRRPRFSQEQLRAAVERLFRDDAPRPRTNSFWWDPFIESVEASIKSYQSIEPATRTAALKFCQALDEPGTAARMKRRFLSMRTRLGDIADHRLVPGDAWTDAAIAWLDAAPHAERTAWAGLLAHASTASSAKPAPAWLREAKRLIDAVGADRCVEITELWLAHFGKPGRRSEFPEGAPRTWQPDPTLIHPANGDSLKGLVWALGIVRTQRAISLIARTAANALKKVGAHGPRCYKVGRAAMQTLGGIGTPEALACLFQLQAQIALPSIARELATAVRSAAERTGMSPADVEEVAVPTFGFTEVGVLRRAVGASEAVIVITGSRRAEVRWTNAKGKPVRTAPKEAKDAAPDEVKEVARLAKQIEQVLPGQRARIERLLSRPERWLTVAQWRERYLDHPIVGVLARRLIWEFECADETQLGAFHDARIVDPCGGTFDADAAQRARLWHPLRSAEPDILAARAWLARHRVVQPFKQAHRETYSLTEDELRTRLYSNRFAGHILRQYQFNALAKQCGWRYRQQGNFDSGNAPHLECPDLGLTAEFEVAGMPELDTPPGGPFYAHVRTDQVRFRRIGAEIVPLTDVPPIAFSEVMRDVDLFVSVCTIGTDPSWNDRGRPGGWWGDYWRSASWPALGEVGRRRAELISELAPQFAFSDRVRAASDHLEVRGRHATYMIHFGTGRVRIRSTGRDLLIAATAIPRADVQSLGVFIPFEGDDKIPEILAKAALLADDAAITDPAILRQILAPE